MPENKSISRRLAVKSSIFGIMAVSLPHASYAKSAKGFENDISGGSKLLNRYPSIDDIIVAEVVGASHFNLDRVKELVDARPELARATWDWGFGDWETAIGAASHVGRKDIVDYLMSKGARPDIFTYAMLGSFNSVKSMIEATPGVQSIAGPHGITLLQHITTGMRSKDISPAKMDEYHQLVTYVENIGGADNRAPDIQMSETDKSKYIGDYLYGEGPEDGFSIKLNMRKMLSLGKIGKFGGGLYQKAPNVFTYNGVSSVEISFQIENNVVHSMTVHEPELVLLAKKI